jgi:hypothetical protein
VRTYVRVQRHPHIPYPRVRAALDAHDLGFLFQHADRLALALPDAVEVLVLIAHQAPEPLEAASLRWLRRYAAEAQGQRLEDYGHFIVGLNALSTEPDFGADQILRLCEERGLAVGGGGNTHQDRHHTRYPGRTECPLRADVPSGNA